MAESSGLPFFPHIFLILAGFVAILYALGRWDKAIERKRREALARKAEAWRFTFSALGSAQKIESMKLFEPLAEGHGHGLFNLMEGQRQGLSFELFDFHFIMGHGKHSRLHRQTVVLLPRLGSGGCKWSLRPENIADAVAGFFGWPDIDFDHRPAFSQRYHLRGDNEKGVRAVFGDLQLHTLEQDPVDYSLASDGERVIVFLANRRLEAEELETQLDRLLGIAALFRNPGAL